MASVKFAPRDYGGFIDKKIIDAINNGELVVDMPSYRILFYLPRDGFDNQDYYQQAISKHNSYSYEYCQNFLEKMCRYHILTQIDGYYYFKLLILKGKIKPVKKKLESIEEG